jgi:hypothetical protein
MHGADLEPAADHEAASRTAYTIRYPSGTNMSYQTDDTIVD